MEVPQKMMGYKKNPTQMDDFGVPLFSIMASQWFLHVLTIICSVVETMSYSIRLGMVETYHLQKNAGDWGMVYHCFNHTIVHIYISDKLHIGKYYH